MLYDKNLHDKIYKYKLYYIGLYNERLEKIITFWCGEALLQLSFFFLLFTFLIFTLSFNYVHKSFKYFLFNHKNFNHTKRARIYN